MSLSKEAKKIYVEISKDNTKLGDLKKIGKAIKKDHALAIELWSTSQFYPRLLAVLIMDKKLLTQAVIDELVEDISSHEYDQRNQLADWLLANQLVKDKKTISLMESWENHSSAILRRLFWYYQARLRWTGQAPPTNTPELLASLEKKMASAEPEVQWAMNFAAGQIGIHEPEFRSRCVNLGEKLGLYRNEPVAKGCTPNYLPEFIRIQVAKRDQ